MNTKPESTAPASFAPAGLFGDLESDEHYELTETLEAEAEAERCYWGVLSQ